MDHAIEIKGGMGKRAMTNLESIVMIGEGIELHTRIKIVKTPAVLSVDVFSLEVR